MKKLIVLLTLIFFVTGCTVQRVDNYSIDDIVNKILIKENKLANQNFSGYKYYLPQGVSILEKHEYNSTLLYNKKKMYLYIDVISYFHKAKGEYQSNSELYYSEAISNGKSYGYLEITEDGDEYYVEMVYNYAKIEGYTDKKDLKNFLITSSHILSSVKFNDKVLASLIGENAIEYKEETFDIFKTDKNKDGNTVLDYDEEYDNIIKEEELKDEDIINNGNTTDFE